MFLKSLELNGFKSFVQKTVLEFPAGITAIVGPNGSGKSNLIDAIRWLLGEREAKNLRSIKAEDLIFAGTSKRPRVSMAQAGLHFDNSKGFFPIDFSEVSVVRRVTRDGNSQYFLNKSETRLKDIVDFFARSRLGTKGLTIINQGNSDLFVRVSPEERRIMIEEILGLREYQIKKIEAERKLKNTIINLDKVRAMIGEIKPHLRMLRRQTAKWEKRSETEKELEELEDKYFSFKLSEIKKSLIDFDPELDKLEKQIAEKKNELSISEGEIKKLKPKDQEQENIKSIKRQQDELLSRRSEIQKEFGRLEAKIELLSVSESGDKIFNIKETLNLIDNIKKSLKTGLNYSEFEKLKKIVEDLIIKIEQFLEDSPDSKSEGINPVRNGISNGVKELEKLKTDLTNNLSSINKDLEQLTKSEQEITDSLESFNKNFQKAFEVKEVKKEEINDLESRKSKIIFEKEKLNLKLQDLKEQISQIGRSAEEFNAIDVVPQSLDLEDTERKMFKLRAHLAS
ncbi:MAG: AAA family ATPase, partial [Candidatus Paceibacterota bacterium]